MSVLLSLVLSQPAHAVIFGGSPVPVDSSTPKIRIVVPGSTVDEATVDLDYVVMHPCGAGSSTNVDIDEVLDLADWVELTLPYGDWCHVDFHWQADGEVEADSGSTTVDIFDDDNTMSVGSSGGSVEFLDVAGPDTELELGLF